MATTDDVTEPVVASHSTLGASDPSVLSWQTNAHLAIDNLSTENKLSGDEKEHLERLINQEDPGILSVLERLSTLEQIKEQILIYLRNSRPRMEPLDSMNKASATMCAEADTNSKVGNAKRAVKQMKKILQTIKTNPNKQRNRMLNKNNFAIKKFVVNTPGAISFLHSVGFRDTEDEKGVEILHLQKEDYKPETIDQALEVLDQTLERLVPIKPGGPRKLCTGGCDFFGDPKLDGLCSVCHKNKVHGRKTSSEKPKPKDVPAARCTNNCGFFGSSAHEGMCSQCFNKKYPDRVEKKKEEPKKHWRQKLKTARVKLDAMRRFHLAVDTAQKDKTRCWQCNKKVGLMAIQCRCRYFFCGKHRSTLDHECSYDYKTDFERILKAENPEIKAKKFDKIDD